MFLSIDSASATPIYEQICRQIVIGIAKGELIPGEGLPSVRQLGEDLGVNLHTVNKAYQQLRTQGYVGMDRRKGAVIQSGVAPMKSLQQEDWEQELTYALAEQWNRGRTLAQLQQIVEELMQQFQKPNFAQEELKEDE